MNEHAIEWCRHPYKVLVIGYGNELRGDDGAGRRLAEQVAFWDWEDVKAISVRQLTPELADEFRCCSLVLFADAREASRDSADVQIVPLLPAKTAARTHHCNPSELLALAEKLHGNAPCAAIITISGEQFGWNEKLSPHAETNVSSALKAARRLIESEQKKAAI